MYLEYITKPQWIIDTNYCETIRCASFGHQLHYTQLVYIIQVPHDRESRDAQSGAGGGSPRHLRRSCEEASSAPPVVVYYCREDVPGLHPTYFDDDTESTVFLPRNS